jgi:hypothetical protein
MIPFHQVGITLVLEGGGPVPARSRFRAYLPRLRVSTSGAAGNSSPRLSPYRLHGSVFFHHAHLGLISLAILPIPIIGLSCGLLFRRWHPFTYGALLPVRLFAGRPIITLSFQRTKIKNPKHFSSFGMQSLGYDFFYLIIRGCCIPGIVVPPIPFLPFLVSWSIDLPVVVFVTEVFITFLFSEQTICSYYISSSHPKNITNIRRISLRYTSGSKYFFARSPIILFNFPRKSCPACFSWPQSWQ